MFDCFIFDVDGTLIDTSEANQEALGRLLLEKTGARPSRAELEAEFGRAGHQTLARYGIGDVAESLSLWSSYVDEIGVSLFDGVLETLRALKDAGKYLGILTSRRWEDLEGDLRRFGLEGLFDRFMCAGDTQRHKPHPEPLYKFFELSPVPRERSLYIGDTDIDARCAGDSGTAFGLACWGSQVAVLEAGDYPQGMRSFADPREILELLVRPSPTCAPKGG